MAYKYRIEHPSSGDSVEYRKDQFASALNTALQCPGEGYAFELYGEKVSQAAFIEACDEDQVAWRSKYREIRVPNGVGAGRTTNGYHTKLIRK